MRKLAIALLLSVLLCGCNAAKQVADQPAPDPSASARWNPELTPRKDPHNPIIVPTQAWEGDNVEDGSVIRVGDTYYRFYCAGTSVFNIGYATAQVEHPPTIFPPAQWTKYANNPIITVQDAYPNAKGFAICAPRVIQMPDGSFRMYVHAFDGTHDRGFLFTTRSNPNPRGQSGFPSKWTIANGGIPIFMEGAPGQWDSRLIQTQMIIPAFDGTPDGLWHMFYFGSNDGIRSEGGHATSPDGIVWTRDPANPVMIPGSADWNMDSVGPNGGWLKRGSTYYLTAGGYTYTPVCNSGGHWSVGYYSTDNLYDLTPSTNPLIQGTPGIWDCAGIEAADILQSNGNIWMFYLGSTIGYGNVYRVGAANWNWRGELENQPGTPR
jgi:hypothetical protein